MKKKEAVIWDNKIKAWVSVQTGRLIAPRLDTDGIDYFFVKAKNEKTAEARYCSGEGYWAYPMTDDEIDAVLRDYSDILQHIRKYTHKQIIRLLK